MNLNWIDDEDYLDEIDNKRVAEELLLQIKQRHIETAEDFFWESRRINGIKSLVRVAKVKKKREEVTQRFVN